MPESYRQLKVPLKRFVVALTAVYLGFAVWSAPHCHLVVVAGLTTIFAATGLVRPIPNPSGGSLFPTNSVKIVAALIWLPQDVLLGVGLGSFIGLVLFLRSEPWRATINGAGWGLAAGAAALAGHAVGGWSAPGLLQLSTAAIAVVCTNRIINEGIFAVYKHLRFGYPFGATWRQNVLDQWVSQVLAAPMAILLAAAAGRLGSMGLSLGLTALSAVALPIPRQELEYYHRSQQAVGEIVEAVVRVLEGVDPDARAHGDRVGELAAEVGWRLRMSEAGIRSMRLAARLHDVGALAGEGGPDAVEQSLTAGSRILSRFPDPLVARIVRAHHERWDGTGIPGGWRGRAIPLAARVLAAAETYDEIRHGSNACSQADAVARLRTLAGTALDPRVVDAVIGVIEERPAETAAAQ